MTFIILFSYSYSLFTVCCTSLLRFVFKILLRLFPAEGLNLLRELLFFSALHFISKIAKGWRSLPMPRSKRQALGKISGLHSSTSIRISLCRLVYALDFIARLLLRKLAIRMLGKLILMAVLYEL